MISFERDRHHPPHKPVDGSYTGQPPSKKLRQNHTSRDGKPQQGLSRSVVWWTNQSSRYVARPMTCPEQPPGIPVRFSEENNGARRGFQSRQVLETQAAPD
jgi:hypothetical protein